MWFLEGDAVAAETALSNAGRGRVPSFEMKLRSQIIQKGIYPYDKAVFGSYNDYVPDHYTMGYHLVAGARKNFGTEIWSDALNKVARYPFMVTPFNKGIKLNSGLSKTNLYNRIMAEIDSLWKEQQKATAISEYTIFINTKKKFYTDYKNPDYIDDSTVIAEKSGIDDIRRYVAVKRDGEERVIFTPGLSFDETLSYSNGIFCWSEKRYDKRWENRSYAEIKIYDIEKKKLKTLTPKSRYFAPALSHNGDKIVAVEVSPENQYSLIILNAGNGEIINKYSSPYGDFFLTPVWCNNDETIITIRLTGDGKSLVMIDPATYESTTLLPSSYTEISKPKVKDKYIFYTAAYSGIDNIYALNINDREVYQVTSSEFGASDIAFSPDGKKIIYSDYTADGYRLVEAGYDPLSWKPLNKVANNSIRLYESIAAQEKGVVNFSGSNQTEYDVKRYRKIPHLLNIHSWAPLSIDVDNTTVNPGVSLMSQNKLSSTFTTFGYKYDLNEETGKYYFNIDYAGLYPILNIKFEKGKRSYTYSDENDQKQRFIWDETSLETGIRVPINITRGKYLRQLLPQVSSTYTSYRYSSSGHGTPDLNFRTMEYGILVYNRLKTSPKDIYPPWGQLIELNFRHTPFGGDDLGKILSAETRLFFPGIIKHHSFNIYAGIQKQDHSGMYRFAGLINYPKGYSGQSSDSLYSISLNYDLPLFYPDLRLGSLIYLKKVRANMFYDYGKGRERGISEIYRSYGSAVLFGFHMLRFVAPIEMGIRLVYVPETNKFTTDFLFAVYFGGL